VGINLFSGITYQVLLVPIISSSETTSPYLPVVTHNRIYKGVVVMPIPLIIIGGAVVGAYILGRLRKRGREKELEDHLNYSESMRSYERKRSRKELIEELKNE